MNSVSFQGNITITTWNKAVSNSKKYTTNKSQDKFIKDFSNSLAKPGEIVTLNKKQANLINNLIEKFIGKEIPKVNNEKLFFNGGDQVVFSDKNPALFDGIRLEVALK